MFAASLSQVNGVNVIKLGHKQVVSLIRQGGNRLLMKVVTVTRKPETEEVIRRKGKVPTMTSCSPRSYQIKLYETCASVSNVDLLTCKCSEL